MATPSNKLKFPTLENVDYFDIIKNKATLKSYSRKEIEGKSWRDLQVLIGKEYGGGVFYYNYKQKNSDVVNRGTIRTIHAGYVEIKETKNVELNELEKIKNQINSISQNNNNVSVDLLIQVTKQSYDLQVSFLKDELNRKQNTIDKLEKVIEERENELTIQDEQIQSLQSKTGINQYLTMAQEFLKLKTGNAPAPVRSLKDSNTDDIPGEILKILGLVDWSKVTPDILNTIVMYLNMYVDKLPLK